MPIPVGVAPNDASAFRAIALRRIHPAYSLFSLCSLAFATTALGQNRATVIKDVTILLPGEAPIEKGSVVFAGGKITGVGPKASGNFMSRDLKVGGKFITPGFVDCWGRNPSLVTADERADGAALDGIDLFNAAAMRALWSQGVVATYVPAPAIRGIGGVGAVLHLAPPQSGPLTAPKGKGDKGSSADDADPLLWVQESAAHFNAAALGDSSIRRLQTLQALRSALKEAREYGESFDDYEDELKEYTDKLAEKAKKAAAAEKGEAGKDGAKPDAAKPGDKPNAGGGSKAASKDNSKPAASGATSSTSSASKKKKKAKPTTPQPGDAEKKKDALKKPTEPTRDPRKETLLRVVNGELPLRAAASHPEDIEVLLDIANEYNLALILEGAHGAAVIADELKETNIPVVLDGTMPSLFFVDGPRRYVRADLSTRLSAADSPLYFGSGAGSADYAAAGSFALAASTALPTLEDAALLKKLTVDAAAWLGCEKKYGALSMGDRADFVVWTAPPFSPGAVVDRVFIDGQEVYRRDDAGADR